MSPYDESKEFRKFNEFIKSQQDESTEPNDSGRGRESRLPAELNGLNWGALVLNVIWGTAMRVHIAWLCVVPLIGMVMPFVLWVKGNEWAWQSRKWRSVEHFRSVQKNWALASLASVVVMFLISLVISIWLSNTLHSLMNV